MATLQKRRRENIDGNFYVDESCIDCDTCRWMAPATFNRQDEQSAVYHQPETATERLEAMQALLSCPTASIGVVEKPQDINKVHETFPILIAENVYHCGYHAKSSFAATSYLIKHSQGNILIDSPQFTPPLVKQLEAMGGVSYLYLTHKDDVADHDKFQQHFNCQRLLHQDDITNNTSSVEIQLKGLEPIQMSSDILIIPTPGHTKGHTVLLYKNKFLFSGDHLAWSDNFQQLYGFRQNCWYSWSEQIKSMEKLAQYKFEWVLPGHGRRYHAELKIMGQEMQKCLAWMKDKNAVDIDGD